VRRPGPGADRAKDPRAGSWGGVARRGARNLEPDPGRPKEAARDRGAPRRVEQDQWIDEGPVRDEAASAVARGGKGAKAARTRRPKGELPPEVAAELGKAVGAGRAGKVHERLREATKAYGAERWRDARRVLAPLAEQAPSAASVRELHGLTLYRMGRWREAIRELEAFETLTGSVDQHPVMADCHRALGHADRVLELWDELRRGGAPIEVLSEGRIVTAATIADRGDLPRAIALLEDGPVGVRNPQEHHLRLWYALGSLYERAGDVPRARELFRRICMSDVTFSDAAERHDALV
jgi:predicted Zn-dependent protease